MTGGAIETKTRVVVVGAGVAGVSAAVAASKEGAETTLIESSKQIGFSRANLPLLLAGDSTEADLFVPQVKSLSEEGVRVRSGTSAASVRIGERDLVLEARDGGGPRLLAFDSLVLCTGAASQVPELRGISKPNVFVLQAPSDYVRLSASLDGLRKLVVTGPVPLALRVGEALAKRAEEVHVYSGKGGLESQFYPTGARMIRAASRRRAGGHTVLLVDGQIDSILGVGRAEAVSSGGSVSTCDGVVIVPHSTAAEPIVECERGPAGGMLVDTTMSTSLEGIYAAGDSTEIRFKSGSVAARLYSTSRACGEVAGLNAAGGNARVSVSWAVEQAYFGVEVCSAGLREEEALAIGLEAATESSTSTAGSPASLNEKGKRQVTVSMVYDISTHQVYGLQICGWRASAFSNVASLIVSLGLTVEQLVFVESPYSPGFSYDASPIGLTARRIK